MSIKMFKKLLLKSSKLQIEIEQEQKRTYPDQYRLIKLKKIRLYLKDRLRALVNRSIDSSRSRWSQEVYNK